MFSHRQLANALRFLSIDAIQRANSGHPGMPMGMADIAEVVWNEFLHHNPNNPNWFNRDRFVLSNGHGSMLLYSLLHLTGYDVSIDDLKNFRQFHSKTPGHPEVGDTPGVETTTGPLGQGLANAVGMALAEKMLAARFNKDSFQIINHDTYVFLGDGCLMEGISHEACSLAGTFGLGKLVAFWDDNHISIDGNTDGWFTDDTPKRFEAYGWHVIRDVDGHDAKAIADAIRLARSEVDKPSLICCRTIIGFGSPNKAGTAGCHGSPLGEEEIAKVRTELEWPYAAFDIPEEIYAAWNDQKRGAQLEADWQTQLQAYRKAHPELAAELERRMQGQLPETWDTLCATLFKQCLSVTKATATRAASGTILGTLGSALPELIGGSADLSGSNKTDWKGCTTLTPTQFDANYIHYGVREFGMSAIMNGFALHGGFIPYGGTFLVFHTYAANAFRMAALMKQRVIYVYSHDSIGLGEDGPTHQPIEQIAALRATPNASVWRPCDIVETAVAWKTAIENTQGPTALLLSRQDLVTQPHTAETVKNIARGGYILQDTDGTPDAILIATGSEVELAMQAAKLLLTEHHVKVRVVSMPSVDAFLAQDRDYQTSVLPPDITQRVAIEAGSRAPWYAFVDKKEHIIGMDQFGLSAPMEILFEAFGFTVENIVQTVKTSLNP